MVSQGIARKEKSEIPSLQVIRPQIEVVVKREIVASPEMAQGFFQL